MKMTTGRKIATITITVSALSGCSTLYTESDLEEAERREDANVRAESVSDRRISEEGGTNIEAIDDEKEEVERETDY